MATGTYAVTLMGSPDDVAVLDFSFLSSEANGSMVTGIADADATTSKDITNAIRGMNIIMAVVKPGTGKVVTAAIDVEIVDSFGCDVFGGSLYNLSSVGVAQYAPMVSGGTFVARPVTNGLRLSIAGNSAVNASGNIYVVLKRD